MKIQKSFWGNSQLEDSMLKSILLFNDQKMKSNKKDLILMAILSIITNENGLDDLAIAGILKTRFALDYNADDIKQYVSKLQNLKLVLSSNDGKYRAITNEKQGEYFFSELEKDTEKLFCGIVDRIKSVARINLSANEEIKIKENAKKALSVYYQMYGYSFWGLKEIERDEIPNAVEVASNGLRSNLGRALVGALADVINSPTVHERKVIEKWARAYVAMEVLNLDPSLRNFKQTKLREKTFVIDTDFALNAITNKAKYSTIYREIIKILKGIGCKLYIPTIVLEEIKDHIDAAKKRYAFHGSQLSGMTDDILENVLANVFIEDYVKTIRDNKQSLSFKTYIDNYYDPEYPELLIEKIKSVFGININFLDDIEPLNDELKQRLADEINNITKISAKGIRRDEDKNTRIAETDASLYLTIRKLNQNSAGDDKPLCEKVYLLTQSQKTIGCAKKIGIYNKNIICNPIALYSILQEMGLISGEKLDIINLFENPFLTYTAELIWTEVEPLLRAGAQLKYVEIHRLRIDVDARIDNILTCETFEEKVSEANRLKERGYLFASDLVEAQKIIEDKDKQIAELSQKVELLSQQKKESIRAKNGPNIKQQKQKRKRKSKRR